ncbi:MAG: hypothetical protein NTX15_08480 [Candidatus Kapabacteria bacterium]|nr:hypothetical protein [Candidatus Kapabacteria bacterium]
MGVRLTILFFLILSVQASASVDSCLFSLRPHLTIKEKDLLDVAERWPERTRLVDIERETFLRNAGYADSTGEVPSKIKVEEIARCSTNDSLQIRLLRVLGIEGTKDENIYIVTYSGSTILARSLLAELQASCEGTFLRACTMEADGSIRIGQLRHVFDCDKDEFIKTETLSGLTLRVRDDGSIHETIEGEE